MHQKIVVVGAGFAGLWSAIGAARKLDELSAEAEVLLVNRDSFHGIRVRFYEDDVQDARVPLAGVLEPIGVKLLVGNVCDIDVSGQQLSVRTPSETLQVSYDRLVLAPGSTLFRPEMPGLREYAHSVDTFSEAKTLETHLLGLASQPPSEARSTAVVVGGGLTGIEIACELVHRLKNVLGPDEAVRVVLVNRSKDVGSALGEGVRPVIREALSSLGVQTRLGDSVESISANTVLLDSGEAIATLTPVWAAGLRASSLVEMLPVERDELGRVSVDRFLRVTGVENVFAAGDVARARIDKDHYSLMSCQHARPQGRIAGHNVVADLLGLELIAYSQAEYVTCLDLGSWGAVYTKGWNSEVISQGADAKKIKQTINRIRIYPPTSGGKEELFAAALPEIQAVPKT
jgi:NADH:quinone reductase (non-electrogenic)